MIISIIVLLTGVNIMLGYATYNLFKKVEFYEQAIEEFYVRTSIVLHSMRALDEQKMFETDDEVGTLFQQLVDILGTLRPLLYGVIDADEENRPTDT
jgi:hypothetical protein